MAKKRKKGGRRKARNGYFKNQLNANILPDDLMTRDNQENYEDMLRLIERLNPLPGHRVSFEPQPTRSQLISLISKSGTFHELVYDMYDFFHYYDNEYNHGHQVLKAIFRGYGHSFSKLMKLFHKAVTSMVKYNLDVRVVYYAQFNEKSAKYQKKGRGKK